MLFNSFPFIILLLITLVLFYNKYLYKYQIQILILSSFIFYAYGQPILLLLLFMSASVNAIVSYLIYFEKKENIKKLYAISGIIFNISILSFFKYGPLFGRMLNDINNLNTISDFLINIPLPIGISFYTFQGISLVVDLYRLDKKKEELLFQIDQNFISHYTKTLFFISFFPQLVAGPIVKAYQFYPQIKRKFISDINIEKAIKLLILGYFLKMVIADNLKDQTFWMMYPYFQTQSSISLITMLYGYSIQIFSDFAGYSLIAIGVAKLFGYELPQNFNFPYISKSFSEFWTRWHISLSTWLKEYLYFPLGGNRLGTIRTYINLMIVMLLGGLWHGAAWSYMVWGAYHGLLLVIERFLSQHIKIPSNIIINSLKIIFVFVLVTLGWLLFKLPDFSHVIMYIQAMIENISMTDTSWTLHRLILIFYYSLPVIFYYIHYLIKINFGRNYLNNSFIYAILLFTIFTNSGSSGAFVYFQF